MNEPTNRARAARGLCVVLAGSAMAAVLAVAPASANASPILRGSASGVSAHHVRPMPRLLSTPYARLRMTPNPRLYKTPDPKCFKTPNPRLWSTPDLRMR